MKGFISAVVFLKKQSDIYIYIIKDFDFLSLSLFKPSFVKAITSLVVFNALFGIHRSIALKWYIIHGYRGPLMKLEKSPGNLEPTSNKEL